MDVEAFSIDNDVELLRELQCERFQKEQTRMKTAIAMRAIIAARPAKSRLPPPINLQSRLPSPDDCHLHCQLSPSITTCYHRQLFGVRTPHYHQLQLRFSSEHSLYGWSGQWYKAYSTCNEDTLSYQDVIFWIALLHLMATVMGHGRDGGDEPPHPFGGGFGDHQIDSN
ncbi:unnamed protein product [Lactuca saligna]|uniref:Uncharacterized protein n=1 Tax=Lactuca saligna TaxID=75948 RepID=A0AA36EJD3_LACSI|nr:unnamed protein product [Lactuca saligna]